MKVLKSKTITVYPKATGANTQYYDMESADEAYVYNWLYRLQSDMGELCTYDPELQRDWFKRRPSTFPKGKQGPNSYASMLGGICSAKIQNANKNLSEAQLDAVEHLFTIIADYYAGEEHPPESVRFTKKLFSIEA
jgi:hypothetical protein